MKTIMILPVTFILLLSTFTITNAEMLFADDFEGGLSKDWVVANDDFIVADSEDSLVMPVNQKEKLPIMWGKIKKML